MDRWARMCHGPACSRSYAAQHVSCCCSSAVASYLSLVVSARTTGSLALIKPSVGHAHACPPAELPQRVHACTLRLHTDTVRFGGTAGRMYVWIVQLLFNKGPVWPYSLPRRYVHKHKAIDYSYAGCKNYKLLFFNEWLLRLEMLNRW